jgi:Ca2+-transporting ATPase
LTPTDSAGPGLTTEAARRLLAEHGPNELPATRSRSFGAIALRGRHGTDAPPPPGERGVYLLLGDRLEAAAILVSIGVVIGITLAQQVRSTRALEALRELSSPQARVVRDGERKAHSRRRSRARRRRPRAGRRARPG